MNAGFPKGIAPPSIRFWKVASSFELSLCSHLILKELRPLWVLVTTAHSIICPFSSILFEVNWVGSCPALLLPPRVLFIEKRWRPHCQRLRRCQMEYSWLSLESIRQRASWKPRYRKSSLGLVSCLNGWLFISFPHSLIVWSRLPHRQISCLLSWFTSIAKTPSPIQGDLLAPEARSLTLWFSYSNSSQS